MTTRRRLLAAAAGASAGLAAGALGAGFFGKAAVPRGNIILILSDALRADGLGRIRNVRGRDGSITPNLDRLRSKGLSFDSAIAPSCWTRISVASILWHASPATVEVEHTGDNLTVHTDQPSLPALLKERGYDTAMINANWSLNLPAIENQFDTFISLARTGAGIVRWGPRGDSTLPQSVVAVNREVRGLVRRLSASRRYFLYLHLMDTHEPYYCPDEFLSALGARYRASVTTTRVDDIAMGVKQAKPQDLPLPEALRQLRLHYDAATMVVDDFVRGLLEFFRSRMLLEDTLVIFASDHGEEFADSVEDCTPRVGHRNLTFPNIHSPLFAWSSARRLAGMQIEEPFPLAQGVGELVKWQAGIAARPDFATRGADRTPRDCLSILRTVGYFGGWSFVRGRTKLNGSFDGDRIADEISAYEIGRGDRVRAMATPRYAAAVVRAALPSRLPRAFDIDRASAEQQRGLRALGYFQ